MQSDDVLLEMEDCLQQMTKYARRNSNEVSTKKSPTMVSVEVQANESDIMAENPYCSSHEEIGRTRPCLSSFRADYMNVPSPTDSAESSVDFFLESSVSKPDHETCLLPLACLSSGGVTE